MRIAVSTVQIENVESLSHSVRPPTFFAVEFFICIPQPAPFFAVEFFSCIPRFFIAQIEIFVFPPPVGKRAHLFVSDQDVTIIVKYMSFVRSKGRGHFHS